MDVHWKFFSLEEIKRPPGRRERRATWRAGNTFRTMVLARRRHGDEAVNKLYHEFGTAKHEEKKDLDEATVRVCIEKAGFPPSLLDEALADPTTETEYLDEHPAINKQGASAWPRW